MDVGIGVDTGGWVNGTIRFYAPAPPDSGPPATDIFNGMGARNIPFTMSDESVTVTRSIEGGFKRLTLQTSPVSFQFGGPPTYSFQEHILYALEGQPMTFTMQAMDGTSTSVSGLVVENVEQCIRFEVYLPSPIDLGEEVDGSPVMRPLSFAGGSVAIVTNDSGILYGQITSGTVSPR